MSKYRCIGAGFCGTVWALSEDDGLALKREDGGPDRSLANDYTMHQRVLHCFSKLSDLKRQNITESLKTDTRVKKSPQVQVPKCYRYLTTEDAWWNDNLPMFPAKYSPCNVIVSQRIPPFPQEVRQLLVERYCHPKIQAEISRSEANTDCLIRPYLGRRRTQKTEVKRPPRFTAFSLRNYPLHEDQMEDLGISRCNMEWYARMMGEALATLHWLGEMDGNDIEFVLAPSPCREGQHQNSITNVLGEHTLWILDFDLCRPMPMSLGGVRQAVTAYWRNDPFYPRPRSSLWDDFRRQYLQASEDIIAANCPTGFKERLDLAHLFVQTIEEGK
ncbi:zinc finger protein [Aspergillus ibericus CBS 121593]|uniref:DUF3669 domain-containing protein n=1 Tax=Aspergillus ibericus CBS 121593 TaxID=1448316 RepID=A0A395GMN2_9EURO|nr:hypothetical protein BO80DRAFT_428771 [Aspergillus ibericus CBS 121593]RAK96770.1 hypothetical protein BO80DRAFT_428771 [Aspergillus ibericus CBS 121593]